MLDRHARTASLLTTAALAVVLALLVAGAFHSPLEIDEAYNLQIVHQLLAGHGYATAGALNGSDLSTFDPRITTGPVLLLPVAGAAAALGEHLWVFRLVPVCAFASVVGLWARLGHRVAGAGGGLIAAAGVLSLDTASATGHSSTLFGAGDGLGEFLAVALLIGAALLLDRPGPSGALIGLAVMTKLLAVLAVPSLALFVAVLARRRGRSVAAALARWAAAAALPALAWQLARVLTVGPSRALRLDRDYYHLFLRAGSGFGPASNRSPIVRLGLQRPLLGWVGVALLLVVLVVLVLAAVSVLRRGAGLRLDERWLPVASLLGIAVTMEAWWLLLSDHDWVRHSLLAAFVGLPALLVVGARAIQELPRSSSRLVATVIVVPLSCVMLVGHVRSAWNPPGPTLAQQRAVASRLAATAPSFRFVGIDFSPQLTLLDGVPAQPLGPSGGLLVVPRRDGFVNLAFDQELSLCNRVAWELDGYVACWVEPGTVTTTQGVPEL